MLFVWEGTVGRASVHQPHGFPERVLPRKRLFFSYDGDIFSVAVR